MSVLILVLILGGVAVLCIVAELALAVLEWSCRRIRQGRTEEQHQWPTPNATYFDGVSRPQETFHELQSSSSRHGDTRRRREPRMHAVPASPD